MKRWITPGGSRERSRALAGEMGISPFAAYLLINRGMGDARACREFLDTGTLPFVDPMLLPDMGKAADRILSAMEKAERITIFGDYDVDGITATALMYSYLKEADANVLYMLPSREEDGYGLSRSVIDRIRENDSTLIITVDNGISAQAETEYASGLGIDIVVTDHHKPPETLPEACAVVDAFVPAGESLPFREWAGVGIAFKLACALEAARTGEDAQAVGEAMARRYSDLAALGSIADIVPLTGENRKLTALGIGAMRDRPRAGLLALMRSAKIKTDEVRAADISYGLAPRINSAGRMGSPYGALELMLCGDIIEADRLAAELTSDNMRRLECERAISAEIWKQLRRDPEKLYDRVVVICGKGWNTGIVGISAGRLCDALGKPVIVLSELGDGTSRGSGRCFGDFSLYKALTSCSDMLVAYGGHSQAAGLTIKTEDIPAFTDAINRYAAGYGEMPVQELECDCELHPRHLTAELIKSCAVLEPFGACNPAPHIILRELRIEDIAPLSGGKHHRITASRGGTELTLLYFNSEARYMRYRPGDTIDAAVNAEIDRYGGTEKLKLIIRDIRPSGLDTDEIINGSRLFDSFMRSEPLTGDQAKRLLPDRQQTGDVYRLLYPDGYRGSKEILFRRAARHGVGSAKLLCSLEIMSRSGIIDREDTGNSWVIRLSPDYRAGTGHKVRIEDSEIIIALKAFIERESTG